MWMFAAVKVPGHRDWGRFMSGGSFINYRETVCVLSGRILCCGGADLPFSGKSDSQEL